MLFFFFSLARIHKVDRNGAAHRAGLMNGDVVCTIQGEDGFSISHSRAVEILRASKGSDICLSAQRIIISHSE